MNKSVEKIRNSLKKTKYGIETIIDGLDVSFWGNEFDEVTDEMINFAIDIVKDYSINSQKYDLAALNEIIDSLDEPINEDKVIKELGVPMVSIATEHGATLDYGCVEELGDDYVELRLDRNLVIYEIAFNG